MNTDCNIAITIKGDATTSLVGKHETYHCPVIPRIGETIEVNSELFPLLVTDVQHHAGHNKVTVFVKDKYD